MKPIRKIAIFSDVIMVYRGSKCRKYLTDRFRSARVRRAIDSRPYRLITKIWFENYILD